MRKNVNSGYVVEKVLIGCEGAFVRNVGKKKYNKYNESTLCKRMLRDEALTFQLLYFCHQSDFPVKKISPPKDAETPVESPIPISPSSSVGSSSPFRSTAPPPDYPFDKSILDISHYGIIPQPLGRTSTSATPTMTQVSIRQLVTDSITAALEAQAAT
ncbi:hypothetical protein Tco_1230266 [Tanacetum coccineum]